MVGVEGDGVGAGGWQYFDAGYGCHWDAVSVLRAGRMGVGGDDVHAVVDEFACEVAVAGADFEEGISGSCLGDPPDGCGSDDGEAVLGYVLTAECGAVNVREGGCGLVLGPLCECEVFAVQALEEGVPLFGVGYFDGGDVDGLGGVLERCLPGVQEVLGFGGAVRGGGDCR